MTQMIFFILIVYSYGISYFYTGFSKIQLNKYQNFVQNIFVDVEKVTINCFYFFHYCNFLYSGEVAIPGTETLDFVSSTSTSNTGTRIQLRQQPQITSTFEKMRQWDINSEQSKKIH